MQRRHTKTRNSGHSGVRQRPYSLCHRDLVCNLYFPSIYTPLTYYFHLKYIFYHTITHKLPLVSSSSYFQPLTLPLAKFFPNKIFPIIFKRCTSILPSESSQRKHIFPLPKNERRRVLRFNFLRAFPNCQRISIKGPFPKSVVFNFAIWEKPGIPMHWLV